MNQLMLVFVFIIACFLSASIYVPGLAQQSDIRCTNGKVVKLYTECPSSDNCPFPSGPNTVVICSNPFQSESSNKTINSNGINSGKNSTFPF